MNAPERMLAKSLSYFAVRDSIEPERITAVEGVGEQGHVEVRKLLVGDEILMLHVFRKKGLDPA